MNVCIRSLSLSLSLHLSVSLVLSSSLSLCLSLFVKLRACALTERLIRGCRLRHPIFGPYRPSEDLLPYLRFARPLSPGNKVNQPVFRYYPRVHSLGKKERKKEAESVMEEEGEGGRRTLGRRDEHKRHTHDTDADCAQFCGRMVESERERLLSSLVNNSHVVTWERDTWVPPARLRRRYS